VCISSFCRYLRSCPRKSLTVCREFSSFVTEVPLRLRIPTQIYTQTQQGGRFNRRGETWRLKPSPHSSSHVSPPPSTRQTKYLKKKNVAALCSTQSLSLSLPPPLQTRLSSCVCMCVLQVRRLLFECCSLDPPSPLLVVAVVAVFPPSSRSVSGLCKLAESSIAGAAAAAQPSPSSPPVGRSLPSVIRRLASLSVSCPPKLA
jgi:hypothetical protein